MKLLELFEDPPFDFFTGLTKFSRIMAGYPQQYGFHHDISSNEHRGTFTTQNCRGHIEKVKDGDVTIYRCVFDPENLLTDWARFHEVLEAVKMSAPNYWRYVSETHFKDDADPCFTIKSGTKPGTLDIMVKHDEHEAIKHL